MNRDPILPGSTIGCLGGGQLGRMFALAARKMGYRVHTVDPTPDSPTGQVSDREYTVAFDDIPTLLEFAAGVDVVTYEFENIPTEPLRTLSAGVLLLPGTVYEQPQHVRFGFGRANLPQALERLDRYLG